MYMQAYGGYRITVITPVCGTGNQGSIPCSHPASKSSIYIGQDYGTL